MKVLTMTKDDARKILAEGRSVSHGGWLFGARITKIKGRNQYRVVYGQISALVNDFDFAVKLAEKLFNGEFQGV